MRLELLKPRNPFLIGNGTNGNHKPTNGYRAKKNGNSLKEIVDKTFITRNLFMFLLTDHATPKDEIEVTSNSYFEAFSGKRIASIKITRLSPFGPTLQDTTLTVSTWIERTGNKLHANTTKSKLYSQLLFKVGEIVDPVLMAENEKIIRDLSYIEDVAIVLSPSKLIKDEVDVIIISKDRFEYGFTLEVSPHHSDFSVFNVNMFGIGHRFTTGISTHDAIEPNVGGFFSYRVDNIDGKFINTSVAYYDTYRRNSLNFNIEKLFLSSETRYAGGLYLERAFRSNYIAYKHPIMLDSTLAYFRSDFWQGYVINKNKKTDKSNTILSGRYLYQEFSTNPYPTSNEFIREHHLFMSSLSFSKRNLFKNNLVYSFGITEDIPFGHLIELKAGLDNFKDGIWPYFGFSFSKASILQNKGYINWQFAFDGFLDDSKVKQGTILLKSDYFSKLFYINGNKYRQFINIEFLSGINRFEQEYLTINRRNGIRDFQSDEVKGTSRLKINLETVRFLNWNFYGFRFANYYFSDFAFLSENFRQLLNQDFYAGFGLGLRVHNESLVFNVIDIRLTWFPIVPEGSSHFFFNFTGYPKTRFPDFLGQKPDLIRFQ
jgi:hypothetical protein